MNISELIENIRWKVELMTTTEKIEDRIQLERKIKEELAQLEKENEIRR